MKWRRDGRVISRLRARRRNQLMSAARQHALFEPRLLRFADPPPQAVKQVGSSLFLGLGSVIVA